MSDSCIGNINTTLTELQELMILVEKSYPEVPSILCKISLEKGEKLCEQLRNLSFSETEVSEKIEEVCVPISDVIGFVDDSSEEVSAEDDATIIPVDLCQETEPMIVEPEETASVSSEIVDIEPILGVEPERDETLEVESSFTISWDTAEEDFCLFDCVKDINGSSNIEEEDQCDDISVDDATEELPVLSDDVNVVAIEDHGSEDTVAEVLPEEPVEVSDGENFSEDDESDKEREIKTFSGKELQKIMSINDRFLFRRELFDGDDDEMNATFEDLNHISSYEESLTYLHTRFDWDFESEAVELLCMLLKQRFE